MKTDKILEIMFLVVAILTEIEFIFVRGMFTWLIAVIAVVIVGGLNIIFKLKNKEWMPACMYLVCSIALCMGYFALI